MTDLLTTTPTTLEAPRFGGERFLRVAMVIGRSDIVGGASIHVAQLCVGLADHGVQSTVVVGGDGAFVEYLRERDIPTVVVPPMGRALDPRTDSRALVNVGRAVRRLAPDLVSCHTAKAGVLGRVIAQQLRLPAVYNPHGWSFDDGVPPRQARVYLMLERAAARLPGVIVNVSERDREIAVRHRVGDPSQHVVVHNGVPETASELVSVASDDPPHIVMVARFEPQKDHTTLLHALGHLRDRAWSAELVGDGEGLPAAQQLVHDLGLDDRIRFTGACDDVPARLAHAQIFVLTTNWEGLPLTVLEAMRAGLPIVASAVGGIPEAVEDGITGHLVPRGDIPATRRALAHLIDDPELRTTFGAAGHAVFTARFREDRMIAETAHLYRVTADAYLERRTSARMVG
jgi:glycosyltransferase involved in cell wall biosynthesis